jgi:capsular exopolysaccharide synthesis family protein
VNKGTGVELDLRELMRIARRRWWIVLLIMALAGGTAYVTATRQTDMYSASAKVLVISGRPETSNEYTSLQASRSLAETYRLLIETGPVLDRVVDKLGLPYDAVALDEKVSTAAVGETQLVQVSVTDPDPAKAAEIATTLVEQFQAYITDQVDPRIGAQVEIADPARVPTAPFEPRPMFSLALGLFVGLLLGVGLVALLEFLDNTVKPETNTQELIHAPMLATISNLPKLTPGGGQVYSLSQPRASATEAMRLLRTNLEFASASAPISELVITSPGPGEGKSTVAANLGVVMAQSGIKTVVVDADLRKPTQHRIFGVPNDEGLTTLLTHPERGWETIGKKVALPGLMLIPSGPVPPNPSDLVSAERFHKLIDEIRERVDLVIIDTPPVLSASDSLAIARHSDGVVMVCRSHKTRKEAMQHAAHSVHQGGIRLIGVVLNRLKGQQGASYYGQYYGPETGPVEAAAPRAS